LPFATTRMDFEGIMLYKYVKFKNKIKIKKKKSSLKKIK